MTYQLYFQKVEMMISCLHEHCQMFAEMINQNRTENVLMLKVHK
jgi:hypothetical protein